MKKEEFEKYIKKIRKLIKKNYKPKNYKPKNYELENEHKIYLIKRANYLDRIFKRSLSTKNISQWSVLLIAFGLLLINFYFQNGYLMFFGLGLTISIMIQNIFSLLYFHPYWDRQLNKLIKKE